jgi:methylase of polypeptide subunit release factors
MAAKHALEAALAAQPQDGGLRAQYFAQLETLARQHVGLCDARLPEYDHPLFFRAGTSDIANLLQIFRDGEYDFALHATPRRILDLGAYVGYAAVYLARRFPAAEIFCIEPSPSSFRMLLLNTLPYRAISHLNAAVWRHAGRRRGEADRGVAPLDD